MRSVAGKPEESVFQRRGVRAFFQARRGVTGEQPAPVEYGDAVGEELDFLERVRGKEQSGVAGLQDTVLKKMAEFSGGNGIDAARRFIEKQHMRTVEQCASEAEALHGSGRKRAHLAIESVLELELRGELSDARSCGGRRQSIEPAEEKEVLASGEARIEAVVAAGVKSETAADSGRIARDVVTRDPREAACRQEERGQYAKERGFAGAICAKQGNGFVGRDFQRDAGERRAQGFLEGLE